MKALHEHADETPALGGMSGRLFISMVWLDWWRGIIIWGFPCIKCFSLCKSRTSVPSVICCQHMSDYPFVLNVQVYSCANRWVWKAGAHTTDAAWACATVWFVLHEYKQIHLNTQFDYLFVHAKKGTTLIKWVLLLSLLSPSIILLLLQIAF